MKRVIANILKTMFWTVVALLLLVLGIVQVAYSDWFQDKLRVELMSRVNASGDVKVALNHLSIDFPLDVQLEGLSVVEPQNDTLIAAKKITASVALMPLLYGRVEVDEASLVDARYRMGNVDSAMFMKIVASRLSIKDASVGLASSDINLTQAEIQGGRVDLILKNDTTPTVC